MPASSSHIIFNIGVYKIHIIASNGIQDCGY